MSSCGRGFFAFLPFSSLGEGALAAAAAAFWRPKEEVRALNQREREALPREEEEKHPTRIGQEEGQKYFQHMFSTEI